MTKKEAIQAMLEGKKVRKTDWKSKAFIYFNEDYNMVDDKNCMCSFDGVNNEENGEEYIDYVDWDTAYNHMLKGGVAAIEKRKHTLWENLLMYFNGEGWEECTYLYNILSQAKWRLLESEDDE